jgi:hypothetical protein
LSSNEQRRLGMCQTYGGIWKGDLEPNHQDYGGNGGKTSDVLHTTYYRSRVDVIPPLPPGAMRAAVYVRACLLPIPLICETVTKAPRAINK